jgi:hypothetical protein
MKERTFSLKPFSAADTIPDLKIIGSIIRHSGMLEVRYILTGPLSEIVIPKLSDRPLRKNRLWEETCLEFFLGPVNSEHYWEFNLSPSGDWNVYHFRAYRNGMREESAFSSLPVTVSSRRDSFRLSTKINLDKIVPSDQRFDVGISAVIKPTQGGVTYLALAHTGKDPDFHRRSSFILEL